MKRIMIVMGAVMMISSLVFAQTKEKHHGQRANGLEKLKSELSLNDEQYASIKGINKKYGDQFSQLRKDSVISRSEKHVAIKDLRDKRHAEINAVLTPDQKTKFETIKKERAEKRKEHFKARGEKREAQMIKDLSLTDDQVVKIKAANKAFMEKVMTLRSQSDNNRDANKAEIKKLRMDHETTIQSILTTDQFSKWKEIRKSSNGKFKRKRDKSR